MTAVQKSDVPAGTPATQAPSVRAWVRMTRRWLPIWLEVAGFDQAATTLQSCPPSQVPLVIDELFLSLQDEVLATLDHFIPVDDEVSEPMAVVESSEYILASLPEQVLELVRAGGIAGRAALVAQMALFTALIRMAAHPDSADPGRLAAACSLASSVLRPRADARLRAG